MEKKVFIKKIFFWFLTFLFTYPNDGFCVGVENVNNFTYSISFYDDKVTLQNGVFKGFTSPRDALYVAVAKYELRDLNLDGINDAVVILVGSYGGSGEFYELTVLLSKGKEIVQTNSVVLGDGIKIEKIVVKLPSEDFPVFSRYPTISIFAIAYRDFDAVAFPSQEKVITYSLVGEKLVPYENTVVKKPVLYLYPEKEQKVKVKLAPKGVITKTIPSYKDGWMVKAKPTGKINDQYDYLFYEVNLDKPYPLTNVGWVVPYNQLSIWFDTYLPELGLNKKETNDFKHYWLKELKPYEYYEIRPIDEKFLEENLKVEIDPVPQTFIRVFLHFKGTNIHQNLIDPQIIKKGRKGFTAVEWGGISSVEVKNNYSFLATDVGEIVLRELHIKEHKLSIKVSSNGCTDKNTLKANVNRTQGIVSEDVIHYEITFLREQPDNCKAFFPKGTVIEYNLDKDFGINTKLPYTISIKNLIYPLLPNEPYFEIFLKVEEPKSVDKNTLKQELIKATIRAIEMEIKRYEESNHLDKKEKIDYMKSELKKFKGMSPDSYTLEQTHQDEPLADFKKIGTLMPPIEKEIDIIVTEPFKEGSLLNLEGMTKSGPFYHLAGISDEVARSIEKGRYKVRVYLIYKREYFGFIPNYYIYLEGVVK